MPQINVQLAEYSELFLLVSAFIYTLVFILFAVDAVRSSATIRRVEAELAPEHEDSAPQLIAAGAGQAASRGGESASGDWTSGAPVDEELVDDDLAYTSARRPLANVAIALAVVAVAAHGFAVVARGVATHRWPLGNMFEFLTAAALVVAAVYLVTLIFRDLRFLGTFVSGLVLTMMIAATIGFPTPAGHVQPALQSPWIAIHVTLAVLAIGLFVLGFALSVLQLIQSRREAAVSSGDGGRLAKVPFLRMVPKAFSLESWSYRVNAVGFVFWTLGPMITGAIWARESWGRYWGWDTKEIWTFVIWVVYAGYLHARATRGWTGNRAAWLSIIGFACIVFNYAVVNVYFVGMHSYAGLPE